jgi:predicted RND superfamily exporter protein
MTETPPFTRDELPIEVRRQFEGVYTGSGSGFVLIFPSISQSDGKRVRDFATEVRGAKVDGELKASGEALIMADILNMIADEGPVILTGSVLVIALLLLVLLGNVKAAALALIAPCVTLLALFGWLPAVGLSLNYLNIVLIPVLFGTGEDAGVHLLERVNEGTPLPEAVVEVGGAVAGSLLTTAMGFGAMLVADHSGLRSFGEFAVFGIALNLYISLVGLPAFLALLQRRRANGNDGKPGDKEELCVS